MAYASFGTGYSPAYLHSAEACYNAGKAWALAGNLKLPKQAVVGDSKYRIVGSKTAQARSFVQGWKETWKKPSLSKAEALAEIERQRKVIADLEYQIDFLKSSVATFKDNFIDLCKQTGRL